MAGSLHVGPGRTHRGPHRFGRHRPYHGYYGDYGYYGNYGNWYDMYRLVYGAACYPRYTYYYLPTWYNRCRYYSYTPLYDSYPTMYRFYDIDHYYSGGAADVTYLESDTYGVTLGTEAETTGSVGALSNMYAVPLGPRDVVVESGDAPPVELHTAIERGSRAFAAGQYDEARRWYIQVVLADDGDGYAELLYGVACFATGDYDVAAVAVRQALTDRPQFMDHPIDLRSLYGDDTTLEFHLDSLARFLSDSTRTGSPLSGNDGAFLLGYLYVGAGQAERGLTVLDRLLESDPTDTLASLLRDATFQALRAEAVGGL